MHSHCIHCASLMNQHYVQFSDDPQYSFPRKGVTLVERDLLMTEGSGDFFKKIIYKEGEF